MGNTRTISEQKLAEGGVRQFALTTRKDFKVAIEKAGHPQGQAVTEEKEVKERRFFIRSALKVAGLDASLAEKYSEAQVKEIFPVAKELIYEKAADNACRAAGLAEGVKEKVVIIADRENAEMARAFQVAAVKAVGERSVRYIDIDNDGKFGKRPFSGKNAELYDEITKFSPTVSFYVATSLEGEDKFRIPLIYHLIGKTKGSKLKCAHVHSPGLTPRMMADGMLTDHERIKLITERVAEIVSKAERIRVTTPAGTDITFTLETNGSIKWVPEHTIEKGKMSNLPIGEVFTCPKNATGKIVVDGVLGAHFDREYGLLGKTPVVFKVVDGYCRSVKVLRTDPSDPFQEQKAKKLEAELNVYLKQFENSGRVGELGIGTNEGILAFIGALLQDEKHPGAHVAFGDPIGEETKAKWKVDTHLDCAMRNCTIMVFTEDGNMIKIMRDGEFTEPVMRRMG